MSDPQLENGHIRIANELWEALVGIRIPGEARQVFDFIIRKTLGWGKKTDQIPLSQFCSATGLRKSAIIKARKKLLDMGLITVTQKVNAPTLSYGIIKDFHKWKPLPKKKKTIILKGSVSINSIKKEIRKRDGNICLYCGYDGNIAKENLHVHHINFNQTNNDYNNLITLCKSCHGRFHTNDVGCKEYLINLITQKVNVTQKVNQRNPKSKFAYPKKRPSIDTSSKDTSSKDKPPIIPQGGNEMVQEIFDLWNKYAVNGIPKAQSLTKTRQAKIKTRLEENPDIQYWQDVFSKLQKIPFYCGDNDRGWVVTFDYVMKNDTNYVKIAESSIDRQVKKSNGDYIDELFKKEADEKRNAEEWD